MRTHRFSVGPGLLGLFVGFALLVPYAPAMSEVSTSSRQEMRTESGSAAASNPQRDPSSSAFQPGSAAGGAGRGEPPPQNISQTVIPAICVPVVGVCACVYHWGTACHLTWCPIICG